MDILEVLYKISETLNKNSGIYSRFYLSRISGYDFKIDYKYQYIDSEEEISKVIDGLYTTNGFNIIENYKSFEDAEFLAKEVGMDCLFDIEKMIVDYNQVDSKLKTHNLYIMKANYSKSILMEKKLEQAPIFELRNLYGDIDSKFNFIFNIEQIKEIEKNPNIIYDCYFVNIEDVLEPYVEKTFSVDKMYRFSNDLVINTELFESEDSVDYYNTVLTVKRLIESRVNSFENNVEWKFNRLYINSKFILEFYETHIGFDLTELSDKKLQEDLFKIIKNYNDCTNKMINKYVVIDTNTNEFQQSIKTPLGEINIYPLKTAQIYDFDENCIFYLEEINEKFSDKLLANLYSKNSHYEIVLWDRIDDYRDKLFKGMSDKQYKGIITKLNSISKLVV